MSEVSKVGNSRSFRRRARMVPVQGTSHPSVSGTFTAGQVLTASAGNFPADAVVTYQWFRAGQDIAGETNATHTVVAADTVNRFGCRVILTSPTLGVLNYDVVVRG